jgi:hypothetical protein
MAIEFDPSEQWDRVAAELRAYKQTQEQAWGEIDNATLGRYLAGDLSSDERQQIEQALTQLPELRKLTDIVRDVLDDFDPAAPAPLPEAPKVIPFPQARPAKRMLMRALRSRGALVAAACLLLAIGLTLGGSRLFTFPRQQPTQVASSNVPEAGSLPSDKRSAPVADVESSAKEKKMIEGWKQLGTSATTLLAASQEQLGDYYQQNGDYERAESFLVNAHDLRRKSLGDDDAETIKTSQKLAKVYQLALNTTPPAEAHFLHSTANTLVNPPSPPVLPMGLMPKRDRGYDKACALRERITKQNPAEVKQSVVPALVNGFRSAKTAGDRQLFARALGILGPAAGDAVGDLKNALAAKDTTNDERVVVVWALGRIGPAARPAVPSLLDALQGNSPEVQHAAREALVQLGPYARQDVLASDRKEPLPQEVRARIEGPEGRSGVNDAGSCCSPQLLLETQRQVQQIARRHHVELFAETVANLPKDGKNVADWSKERRTDGIYLLVCKEPPSVQVVVAPALERKGFTPECQAELKKRAEDALKKHEIDRGLRESVGYVAQQLDQAAQRTKVATGSVLGGAGTATLPR